MASLLLAVLLLRSFFAEATQSCFQIEPLLIKQYSSSPYDSLLYTNGSKFVESNGWNIINDPTLLEENKTEIAFLNDVNWKPACPRTVCPNLVKYYTDYVKISDQKYTTQFVSTSENDGAKQLDVAGYLAPTPGYCGATGHPMFEVYSLFSKSYFLVVAGKLEQEALTEDELKFQVTRLLGYPFDNKAELLANGNAPHYIDPSIVNVPKTFHPLLQIYRYKSKTGTKYSYAASNNHVETLNDPTSLYEYEAPSVSLLKFNKDISTARAKCGQTSYLYEVYDNTTDVTRISTKTKFNSNDKVMGLAGLSFKNASSKCQFTREAVEYQNKNDPTQFIISFSDDTQYSSSDDWIIAQRLGFVRSGSLLLSV